LRCPKCDSEFESFTQQSSTANRCTGCGGIWLDALEPADGKQIKASGRIDSGDKQLGKKLNEMRNIQCPRCGVRMLTVTDTTQFHIEFEICPSCSGTFYDAGEFKDLSELTVVERLRKVLDDLLLVR